MRSEGTFTVTRILKHTHTPAHTWACANAHHSQLKPLPPAPVFVKALWPDHRHGTRCNATERRKEHWNWDTGLFQRACMCERVRTAERMREYGTSESHILYWHTPTHLERPVVPPTWQLSSAFWLKFPAAMWEITRWYVSVYACVCLYI